MNEIYITITGANYYMGIQMIKPHATYTIEKEKDNDFDDEAIIVKDEKNIALGHVANSSNTVARGTHSAGYIYEKFKDRALVEVMFVTNSKAIARLIINEK